MNNLEELYKKLSAIQSRRGKLITFEMRLSELTDIDSKICKAWRDKLLKAREDLLPEYKRINKIIQYAVLADLTTQIRELLEQPIFPEKSNDSKNKL